MTPHAAAAKPTEYRGVLDMIHEWVESEIDMLPEELEPEALAWLIRKLGNERDTLMEIVRLGYETCKCPHCGALLNDGSIHLEGCRLREAQLMAITEGGRNLEAIHGA